MNLDNYRSGDWKQQSDYKIFSPTLVNHGWTWGNPRINTLLEESIRALSRLDASSKIVPDVNLFIHMHIATEANMSNRIEGTQTEMDEVLSPKAVIPPERREDWQEVQNYIKAMNEAIEELDKLPLSNRLLRNTHKTLM